MHIYIQALDYQLWKVIINGSHTPTINVDGIHCSKPKVDWDVHDMKQIELNTKAMNLLYYLLDINEFNVTFFLYFSQTNIGSTENNLWKRKSKRKIKLPKR